MQRAPFSLWTSADGQVQRLIAAPKQCWKGPPVVKKNTNWQPFWLVLAPSLPSEIQMPWEPNVPGIQAFCSQQSSGQKANWLLETLLRYLQEKQKGLFLLTHVCIYQGAMAKQIDDKKPMLLYKSFSCKVGWGKVFEITMQNTFPIETCTKLLFLTFAI